ncbi:hypothetical protein JZ751_000167 [Albula glossodonta]|uniref:Uncharacterized protein n=1 Tax=Albula glossodonta TaxID=121402 RepID=A0A8T2PVD4_9TELE|nr:hypothetical protein JZ751_000167 [Albula glossodonta]
MSAYYVSFKPPPPFFSPSFLTLPTQPHQVLPPCAASVSLSHLLQQCQLESQCGG